MSLPDDWRAQVSRMVAGAQPLDGTLFRGGPVLSPLDQIGVYANQYRLRLWGALEDETIGLRALLGEEAKTLLWRYLDAHPSRSWTLERVAVALVGWLEAEGAPVEQIEMARLDRAVQRGFTAADGTPLTAEQLGALPALVPSPSVSLLRLTTNVHEVRSAAREQREVDVHHDRDVRLVVYRGPSGMLHLEVEPEVFALLTCFGEGQSIPEALETLVVSHGVAPETLGERVQHWFQRLAQHGLVSLRDS